MTADTWLFTVSENKVDKKDCTITLMEGSGMQPAITWSVIEAFPVRAVRRAGQGPGTGHGC
ncbi:hypothetical protein [Streptomyces sp. NPDC055749]